jgi:hypothetical protein
MYVYVCVIYMRDLEVMLPCRLSVAVKSYTYRMSLFDWELNYSKD